MLGLLLGLLGAGSVYLGANIGRSINNDSYLDSYYPRYIRSEHRKKYHPYNDFRKLYGL